MIFQQEQNWALVLSFVAIIIASSSDGSFQQRGDIYHYWHKRRQCKSFATIVNFSRKRHNLSQNWHKKSSSIREIGSRASLTVIFPEVRIRKEIEIILAGTEKSFTWICLKCDQLHNTCVFWYLLFRLSTGEHYSHFQPSIFHIILVFGNDIIFIAIGFNWVALVETLTPNLR